MTHQPVNPADAGGRNKGDRLPRFRPSATIRPRDEADLDALDHALLEHVHAFRLLATPHCVALCPQVAPRTVKDRLQLLFHNEYLTRPVAQLHGWTNGSLPLVYTLARRGARVLNARGYPLPAGHSWTEKSRTLTSSAILHRTGISTFRVALTLGAAAQGFTLEPVAHRMATWWEPGTHANDRPRVTLQHAGQAFTLGVCPDGFFSLAEPSAREHPCFLEYDTGSMPVMRPNLALTSIARKLAIYATLWDEELAYGKGLVARSPLRTFFDVEAFRVLFVTTSAERIASMVAATQALLPKGRGQFWFTTADRVTLENPGALLTAPMWYTGKTPLGGSAARPTLAGPPVALV